MLKSKTNSKSRSKSLRRRRSQKTHKNKVHRGGTRNDPKVAPHQGNNNNNNNDPNGIPHGGPNTTHQDPQGRPRFRRSRRHALHGTRPLPGGQHDPRLPPPGPSPSHIDP
jgi:hypothetical protein